MTESPLILVINPGSTTTKIAIFEGTEMLKELELTHTASDLAKFKASLEQLDYRFEAVSKAITDMGYKESDLKAAIGRGGPIKPLESGVYHVGDALLKDLISGHATDHASLLGGLIAYKIAQKNNIPAYIADPISVDEFEDVARISGCPELPRISLVHALNIKAVAEEVALEEGKKLNEVNYIVAHLGGGFSICPLKKGRLIDANNANDAGPMSPERCGTVPLQGLLKMCFSGQYDYPTLRKKLIGRGGLVGHVGTADCREITKMIEAGDKHAKLCLEAMAYQIAKEIGAMAAVLKGEVDKIILTGGVAHNKIVMDYIKERVSFIAPIKVRPGQNEMKALAIHAVKALKCSEIIKEYI
ncbi:MAG: butyrate kinase [Candidatus Riflebacteria bacterium]|nr:butyrate kinase [Candidatus Riflebacteria bacterium]